MNRWLLWVTLTALGAGPIPSCSRPGIEQAPREPASLVFVVIADTHTIGTPTTGRAVYARIIEQVNLIKPDLLVHAGDMIVAPAFYHYDGGRASVDTFMAYTGRLAPSIEFWPVLGNHEGEIDGFGLAISTFPQFEGRGWYSFDRRGSHFFIVENNSDTRDSTKAGYEFCRPNGGLNTPGSPQRQWLKSDLRNRPPDSKWTFGFGHRAYYGAEGRNFRPSVVEARQGAGSFCNLIEEEGVDVFFNGDQHCYTRTAPIRAGRAAAHGEPGTLYITCGGGGGKIRRARPFPGLEDMPEGAYVTGTDSLHFFVLCRVWDDLLRAEVIDTSGTVFDRWEIRKRGD